MSPINGRLRTALSVNVNKIALLRNSRDTGSPDLLELVELVIASGADGITVHPRPDSRHITLDDVVALSRIPAIRKGDIELNVEGDGRPELLRLLDIVRPTQFTLVPGTAGELTSERGWRAYDDHALLQQVAHRWSGDVRISVFADPTDTSVRLAGVAGVAAVEFYTGAYAAQFSRGEEGELTKLINAAKVARSLGLRVHCGHDLDLKNLPSLLKALTPDECSIGHEIVTDSLRHGLGQTTRRYLEMIGQSGK